MLADIAMVSKLILEQRIAYRCLLIASRITRFLAPMWESRYGLSIADWRVLAVIARYGPLSATEAATYSSTEAFHITRAVDRLIKRRLVKRAIDFSDKRRVRLNLTTKGRRAHGDIEHVMVRVEAYLLDGIKETDRVGMDNGLVALQERTLGLIGSTLTWKYFIEMR